MDKSASDPGLRGSSESAERINDGSEHEHHHQVGNLDRSAEVEDLTVSFFN